MTPRRLLIILSIPALALFIWIFAGEMGADTPAQDSSPTDTPSTKESRALAKRKRVRRARRAQLARQRAEGSQELEEGVSLADTKLAFPQGEEIGVVRYNLRGITEAQTKMPLRRLLDGRLKTDAFLKVPISAGETRWALDAKAGSRVLLKVTGAAWVVVFAPRKAGGIWKRILRQAPGPDAILSLSFKESGQHIVVFKPHEDTEVGVELALSCRSKTPCEPNPWSQELPAGTLRIIAVGDASLQAQGTSADPLGDGEGEEAQLFHEMIAGVEPFLDGGDLNLINIESAITTSEKPEHTVAYRIPPEGLGILVAAGFNFLAFANEHVDDFGPEGIRDTIAALRTLQVVTPKLHWGGLGLTRAAALKPLITEVKNIPVTFLALGFGADLPSRGPSIAPFDQAYRALDRFKKTPPGLKIISLHAGVEGSLQTTAQLRTRARNLCDAGAHLVYGHHPHVVQGIERHKDCIILYSVGDFLRRGTPPMESQRPEVDHGLMVRLGFDPKEERITHLEVVPISGTHRMVYPMEPATAASRIMTLNRRSARDFPDTMVSLHPHPTTGHGLAAFDPPGGDVLTSKPPTQNLEDPNHQKLCQLWGLPHLGGACWFPFDAVLKTLLGETPDAPEEDLPLLVLPNDCHPWSFASILASCTPIDETETAPDFSDLTLPNLTLPTLLEPLIAPNKAENITTDKHTKPCLPLGLGGVFSSCLQLKVP